MKDDLYFSQSHGLKRMLTRGWLWSRVGMDQEGGRTTIDGRWARQYVKSWLAPATAHPRKGISWF